MEVRRIDCNDAEKRADEGPTGPPRLGIMGEFSAGKSTLTNLLIGANALPVKVTATQLPPVWLSYGNARPHRVDLQGEAHAVSLEDLGEIPLDETQHIRVQCRADFLKRFELIDFPGISDPNMSAEVWERAVPLVDAVLWCTHANQAWRQSEAAVWEEISKTFSQNSLLLLTRMDKIVRQEDRARLLARVQRETVGLFADLIPVSLTQALTAKPGSEQFTSSGAQDFLDALDRIENTLARQERRPQPKVTAVPPPDDAGIQPSKTEPAPPSPEPSDQASRVVPRRVSLRKWSASNPRPRRVNAPNETRSLILDTSMKAPSKRADRIHPAVGAYSYF